MKPVEPVRPLNIVARRVVFGDGQPEYNVLPALVEPDGTVHTRWDLTMVERQAILDGACITLTMLTFGQPPMPVHLSVEGVGAHCRVCGCTDAAACEGGCSWVEPDLCSACQPVASGRAN